MDGAETGLEIIQDMDMNRNESDRNMVTLMIDTITTVGITPKTKIRNPRKNGGIHDRNL